MDRILVKFMVGFRGLYLALFLGDGGGFSSTGYSGGDFQDRPSRSAQFEEYDEFDDGGARATVQRSSIPRKSTPKKEKPSPVKDVDLFSFDDDVSTTASAATGTTSSGKGKAVETSAADDDFDDFQSAVGTPTPTSTSAKPTSTSMPSRFSPPPVQSNPIQTNISSTPSYSGFGISSPPLSQPARSPIPQTSFTSMTPSTAATTKSQAPNYQPNYFSQPIPTTVFSSRIVADFLRLLLHKQNLQLMHSGVYGLVH
jgi:epsin